ncbi:MAG: nucleotide pyrophosphatase/phosphodiesterase family protein [Verrucomicrobiota bacterium]|jgi:predicted AlkP superfamily pyrophosphatase or phosphodiesterase
MRLARKLFTTLIPLFAAASLFAAGKATQVVLLVWDGLRPDFVTEENTPTLVKLARQGVTFKNHHPVYISATEVNGTALATGVYPGQSGIVGNKEYRPALDATKPIMTASLAAIRKADALTGNHYLAFPTVAEILHAQGLRTVIAGAKPVALLHDRFPRSDDRQGVDLFAGKVLPEALAAKLAGQLGPFPAKAKSSPERDAWTTEALTGPLWEKGVPPFSVLWLSEPDSSQHLHGPGSPAALAAIKSADQNLARVLAALAQKGLREQTDIIVVSDHGFSTVARNTDVAKALNEHGFHAGREFPEPGPRQGDILVVGNGGSAFLYVTGHEPALVKKVVHFLQAQPFCGVVLTRQPVAGAFSLEQARLNAATAPDIVLSLRWNRDRNQHGTPGQLCSDQSDYGPGQGMHGSLSPFDMHNTCVAAGPDFRHGVLDDLPTGNIDIAPTVLWLLGVQPSQKQSGRLLREALLQPPAPAPSPKSHHLEASYRAENFLWRQYLNYSTVNGALYLDEGNGQQAPLGVTWAGPSISSPSQ